MVILYHARLGFPFLLLPSHAYDLPGQASTLCAFGLAPRRVELTCGPRGQGTCSLPRGRDTTLSIRTTNESPGNLRGWRRGCERIQGHTREHKAHVRAHLTRQAGSGRAWADWGHAIDPLNIPRFTLTPEQLTSLWLVTRPAQATPRQCNPWAFVSCRAAAVVCHGSAPVRLRAVTHLVPFGRHVLVFCNPTFYWR